MPDSRQKSERPTPHRDKLCKICGKPFAWRKQWERDWDIIKYCNDACRGQHPSDVDNQLEAAILDLLHERDPGKTICPSEAAKLGGGKESRRDWEGLMEPAREAARRLAVCKLIVITQHGKPVDPATAKGPIRLRLYQS